MIDDNKSAKGSPGSQAAIYAYAPFGEVAAGGAVTQPFQWSSEYHDTELGMIYYNYRYYNPTDGRCISRDFISEGEEYSIYSYVSNQPIATFDSIGLRKFAVDWVTGWMYTDAPAVFSTSAYTRVESNCSVQTSQKVTFEITEEVNVSFSGDFRGFSAQLSTGRKTTEIRELNLSCCRAMRYRYDFFCQTQKVNFLFWLVTFDLSVLKYRLICQCTNISLEDVDVSIVCPNCTK